MPPSSDAGARPAVAVLAMMLAACGGSTPDVEVVCERMRECADADVDKLAHCEEGAHQWADEAIAAGCGAELDAYLVCFEHIDVCAQPPPTNACRTEAEAMGACSTAG